MADPNYMYEYGASRTYVGGYFGEFWAYETAGIIQNEAEISLSSSRMRAIVCFNSIDLAGIFEPMETPAATWISAVLDWYNDL